MPVWEAGAKMITPFLQLRPRPNGASQIVIGAPPATRIFFNFPSAKKAIHCPSGDQKGKVAPSVRSRGSADNFASVRIQILADPLLPMATNANFLPSGESTTEPPSSLMRLNVAPSGGRT